MDRDTIIQLAREAGFNKTGRAPAYYAMPEEIERFAALVAAHEREECAKVCEERKINPAAWMVDKFYNQAVEHCAAAIRSRT